jgi:hypothetical protein
MNTNVKSKMQELQNSIRDLTRNAEQYEQELVRTTCKADEIGKLIEDFQFNSKYMVARDDSDDFTPSSYDTDYSATIGGESSKSYDDDVSSESKYSARKYSSRSFEPDEDILDFDSKYSSSTSSRFSSKSTEEEEQPTTTTKYSSSSSRVKRALRARRRSRHDLSIVS